MSTGVVGTPGGPLPGYMMSQPGQTAIDYQNSLPEAQTNPYFQQYLRAINQPGFQARPTYQYQPGDVFDPMGHGPVIIGGKPVNIPAMKLPPPSEHYALLGAGTPTAPAFGAAPAAPAWGAPPTAAAWGAAPAAATFGAAPGTPAFGAAPGAPTYGYGPRPAAAAAPPAAPAPVNPLQAAIRRPVAAASFQPQAQPAAFQSSFAPDDFRRRPFAAAPG